MRKRRSSGASQSSQPPRIQFMYAVSLASSSGLKKLRCWMSWPDLVIGSVSTDEFSMRIEPWLYMRARRVTF